MVSNHEPNSRCVLNKGCIKATSCHDVVKLLDGLLRPPQFRSLLGSSQASSDRHCPSTIASAVLKVQKSKPGLGEPINACVDQLWEKRKWSPIEFTWGDQIWFGLPDQIIHDRCLVSIPETISLPVITQKQHLHCLSVTFIVGKMSAQFSGSGSCDYGQQTMASDTMHIPYSYIMSG